MTEKLASSIWEKRYQDGDIVCTKKKLVDTDPFDFTLSALIEY